MVSHYVNTWNPLVIRWTFYKLSNDKKHISALLLIGFFLCCNLVTWRALTLLLYGNIIISVSRMHWSRGHQFRKCKFPSKFISNTIGRIFHHTQLKQNLVFLSTLHSVSVTSSIYCKVKGTRLPLLTLKSASVSRIYNFSRMIELHLTFSKPKLVTKMAFSGFALHWVRGELELWVKLNIFGGTFYENTASLNYFCP